MRWCRGVSSRLDWRSRCCSRRLTVSLLFRESRVVGMRVRHWKDGRVETNSSISRQHVPKPRPLVAVNFSYLRNIMIVPIRTSDKHIAVLVIVLRMKTFFHVYFGLDRKKEHQNFRKRNLSAPFCRAPQYLTPATHYIVRLLAIHK